MSMKQKMLLIAGATLASVVTVNATVMPDPLGALLGAVQAYPEAQCTVGEYNPFVQTQAYHIATPFGAQHLVLVSETEANQVLMELCAPENWHSVPTSPDP